MKRILAAFLLLSAGVFAACADAPVVARTDSSGSGSALTDEQAQQIVGKFEAQQATDDANEPLRTPKSFDDAVEILKRDQIDLFAAGVQWASTQADPKSKALAAQMELSWGEAQSLIAEILNSTLVHLRSEQSRLESKASSGDLNPADKKRLDTLRDFVAKKSVLADALQKVAQQHIAKGAVLAKAVIDANPNDYHGYRVAADYYRLRQDWTNFDAMVAKLETANPNSNGLLFAKGMAAQERDHSPATATKLLKSALANDPKFTRAEAELVLIQTDADSAFTEYQALKALNPHHQLVGWAGDVIEDAQAQAELARRAHTEEDEEARRRRLEWEQEHNGRPGGK